MIPRHLMKLALVFALVPALGACNNDADVEVDDAAPASVEATNDQAVDARVTEVELGRSIDANGRIADGASTDDFGVSDTIYVSVNTDGTAAGKRLTARWTFEDGQVVDETSQTISASGPATTHFHISKPDGWPAGSYKVEIQLDGRTVETEEFEIG